MREGGERGIIMSDESRLERANRDWSSTCMHDAEERLMVRGVSIRAPLKRSAVEWAKKDRMGRKERARSSGRKGKGDGGGRTRRESCAWRIERVIES